MCKITLNYTSIDWNCIFDYCENSPSGLIWKNSERPKRNGTIAGAKSFDNRTGLPHMWRVNYKGKRWAIHRIIMLMQGFKLDNELVVDHIDGNPFNNNLSNLRILSQTHNAQNRRKTEGLSKTGIVGCSLGTNGQGRTYISAFWHTNRKVYQKRFSVDDLGYEIALNMAKEYRKKKLEELNNFGANYSERHGT